METRNSRRARLGLLLCCLPALPVLLLSGCVEPHPRYLMAEFRSPYAAPLTSPGEKFGGLPLAAQNTIRAQTGVAEIDDIIKESHLGIVAYRVTFRKNHVFGPLWVRADGSVLNPDLTVAVPAPEPIIGPTTGGAAGGLKLSDLPAAVSKVVREKVPDAEIESIYAIVEAGQTVYLVSFKESAKHGPLRVAADGTVLSMQAH